MSPLTAIARSTRRRCTRRDERRRAHAERDDPDEQAETEVGDEVDRASEPDVAAGSHQPREAELEAEEEEKEDDAELGDELGDLGRADEVELARLVRAEEEAGEEVRGDRGQAEPAGDEPERAARPRR